MSVMLPGGRVPTDTSNDFRSNLNAGAGYSPFLGLNQSDNNSARPGMGETASQVLGTWFKVPDASLKLVRSNLFVTRNLVWTLPDGSKMLLSSGDVQYSLGFRHLIHTSVLDDDWDVTQVYVRATPATLPGLRAFGLARNIDASDLPTTPTKPPAPTWLDNVVKIADSGSGVAKSYATIVVVGGLVFLAVWLGGKNILKG